MKRSQPGGPSAPARRRCVLLSILFLWLLLAGLVSPPLHGSIPRDRHPTVELPALIEEPPAAELVASVFPPARLELGLSEGDEAILRRVLVRQNPWSAFDPEGLKADDLSFDGPARFSFSLDDAHNVVADSSPTAEDNVIAQQTNVDLRRGPVSPTISGTQQVAISDAAIKLIYDFEVGGGRAYYNRFLRRPSYPGARSGVTIGIGYDIGYNSKRGFLRDWDSFLESDQLTRLSETVGKKGTNAKVLIPGLRDISIQWQSAESVFYKSTLPRFIDETVGAYPGASALSPDALGALVSMSFNRGTSMRGNTRSELRQIRSSIRSGTSEDVPNFIRQSKRIWRGKDIERQMYRRRDAEAALFEKGAHP